jgi:hypothetical protein
VRHPTKLVPFLLLGRNFLVLPPLYFTGWMTLKKSTLKFISMFLKKYKGAILCSALDLINLLWEWKIRSVLKVLWFLKLRRAWIID